MKAQTRSRKKKREHELRVVAALSFALGLGLFLLILGCVAFESRESEFSLSNQLAKEFKMKKGEAYRAQSGAF